MPKRVIMFDNAENVSITKDWIQTAFDILNINEGFSADGNYIITINFGYTSLTNKNYYKQLEKIVNKSPVQNANPHAYNMIRKSIPIYEITYDMLKEKNNI